MKFKDGEVDLLDWYAMHATDGDIDRYRGAFENPGGGSLIGYKYTREQARYRFAEAMISARRDVQQRSD